MASVFFGSEPAGFFDARCVLLVCLGLGVLDTLDMSDKLPASPLKLGGLAQALCM